MRTLKEALISKNKRDWAGAKKKIYRSYKKKDLKTGDMVQLQNGDFMLFIKEGDADFYKDGYTSSPESWDGDQFIEWDTDWGVSFLHLSLYELTKDLKCNDMRSFNVVKVVPGVLDPKIIHDSRKVYNFLKNKKNYEMYFYD